MCRFVEALCIINGKIENIEYNQKRVDRTFRNFFPDIKPFSISSIVPDVSKNGKFKWRVTYADKIIDTDIAPYSMRVLNTIHVEEVSFDYSYKYEDRTNINAVTGRFPKDCCVLFSRDGFLTDAFFSNIALLKDGTWYTPEEPLLEGTRRSYLLDRGLIAKKQIPAADLYKYERLSCINALLDLDVLSINLQK